jgi:hypothetical protein
MSPTTHDPKRRYGSLLTMSVLLLAALLFAIFATTTRAQETDSPTVDDENTVIEHEIKYLSITEHGDLRTVELEIPASQDAFVASGQPNNNFGSDPFMRVGYNQDPPTYGAMRSFIQFNVGAVIPSNAIVNSATYQLYVAGATPAGDPPMAIQSRHLGSAWNQSTITWNSHEPDWGSIIGQTDVPSNVSFIEGNITALVQEWVSGSHSNYGVMLQGDETQRERQRSFYTLNANNGLYPRLIVSYTISNDNTPPVAQVNGLPRYSASPFTVSWTGNDNESTDPNATGIAYYRVQYNANGGSWVDWIANTTNTSAEFGSGANGQTYQFRVTAVDKAGNAQSWNNTPITQTTVDTVAPNITMNSLPEYTYSNSFTISWVGSDNPGGSGIAYYDVQFQVNDGNWQSGLTNYTSTSFNVTGAQSGVTYGFRARGVDNVGNKQPWSSIAQAETTIVATPISVVNQFDPSIIQPGNPDPTKVRVTWESWTPPGTAITSYSLYYQVNKGTWILATQTTNEFYDFVFPTDETTIYGFEVVATNNTGASEPFNNVFEAEVVYNMQAPYIEPAIFMPLIRQ